MEIAKTSRKWDGFDRHLVQFLLEEEPTDMNKSRRGARKKGRTATEAYTRLDWRLQACLNFSGCHYLGEGIGLCSSPI